MGSGRRDSHRSDMETQRYRMILLTCLSLTVRFSPVFVEGANVQEMRGTL